MPIKVIQGEEDKGPKAEYEGVPGVDHDLVKILRSSPYTAA